MGLPRPTHLWFATFFKALLVSRVAPGCPDQPVARVPGHSVCTAKQVQVSIRRIQYEKAWSTVQEMQTNDVVFEGQVVAVNRGGAIVLVEVHPSGVDFGCEPRSVHTGPKTSNRLARETVDILFQDVLAFPRDALAPHVSLFLPGRG